MTTFVEAMLEDDSTILVTKPRTDIVFTFSNSGRSGVRSWFAMTGSQISICLKDLLAAGDILPVHYEEKQWRKIFSEHLTDDVARTMGAVQTLPLFEIIAKIVHYTNSSAPRSFKTINLSPMAVRNAITVLARYSETPG
jgi:hypothetical protein